jgi:hypothetical protein
MTKKYSGLKFKEIKLLSHYNQSTDRQKEGRGTPHGGCRWRELLVHEAGCCKSYLTDKESSYCVENGRRSCATPSQKIKLRIIALDIGLGQNLWWNLRNGAKVRDLKLGIRASVRHMN